MKLEKHFNELINKISLNNTRKERISSSLSHLSSFLKENEYLKDVLIDFYTQGSYAINTCIKPSNGNDFDVDSVLELNSIKLPEECQNPTDLINWISAQLKSDSTYESKVKKHNRCVRIDYEGDFHLDIVPSIPYGYDSKIIHVPDRNLESWILSNPKGYVEWCKAVKQNSNFSFSRIVKMLKYWRDSSFGKSSRPSSILFTTLIGQNFDQNQSSTAETLIGTMNNIKSYLDLFDSRPVISNPSLKSEDLARDWADDNFTLFKNLLVSTIENCKSAFQEEDKEKCIDKWQKVFPDFPSKLPEEAIAINTARKEGTLFVNPSGVLIIGSQGDKNMTRVLNHRNYGY